MSRRVIAKKSGGMVLLYSFITIFLLVIWLVFRPHLDFHEAGSWFLSLFYLFGWSFSTFHLVRLLCLPRNLVVEDGDTLTVYTGFGKRQMFTYDEITSMTILSDMRYMSGTIFFTTLKGDAIVMSCMDVVDAYGTIVEERARRKAKAEFVRAEKAESRDSISG